MWPFTKPSQSLKLSQGRRRLLDRRTGLAGRPAQHRRAGFRTIICARPDHEEPGQPRFADIASAAERAGIKAVHIPVQGMPGEGQLIRMEQALKDLPRPILGYCRSGARAGSLYTITRRAIG